MGWNPTLGTKFSLIFLVKNIQCAPNVKPQIKMNELTKKTITRNYGTHTMIAGFPSRTPIWSMNFNISLDEWVSGEKFFVNEQRAGFNDKKVLFVGSREEAKKVYDSIDNQDCVSNMFID